MEENKTQARRTDQRGYPHRGPVQVPAQSQVLLDALPSQQGAEIGDGFALAALLARLVDCFPQQKNQVWVVCGNNNDNNNKNNQTTEEIQTHNAQTGSAGAVLD